MALPKTNQLGTDTSNCSSAVTVECTDREFLFSKSSGQSVRLCLKENEVVRLSAFILPSGSTIKIFEEDKEGGIDCVDCGTGAMIPYAPCCNFGQKQLDKDTKNQYVTGAGCYVFVSDAPAGVPRVKIFKTQLQNMPESFLCIDCEPPCPLVSITTISTGTTSASVTIVTGSDDYGRDVTVKLFNGENEYEQVGVNGDVLVFTDLEPNTTYSVFAENDCGNRDSSQVTTQACPAVVLTMAAAGTNSVTVTVVSGGAAWVTVEGKRQYLANGATGTFAGLQPDTTYFAEAMSDCGSIGVASAQTAPCPAIILTQTGSTTSSITVSLTSGGLASVFIGGEEAVLANGGSFTFTGLTAGRTYTAKVVSACGNTLSAPVATAACPAVDFTATAVNTTTLEVTALAGMPLTISVVSQGGAVLDSVDNVSSTVVFNNLPEGAIITVKAVNECGKTKQLNVNLPDAPAAPTPPCPSFSLADASPAFKGFAFVAGDVIDPAATVPFRGGLIYPTAGAGHTVKVTDAASVVIGYAVNKSDCANPCCAPVVTLKNCDGLIIDPEQEKILTVGSLLSCDGLPLPCKAKVKQCCDVEVFWDESNANAGGGLCINYTPSGFDSFGRSIWRSRDGSVIAGSGSSMPVGAKFLRQLTYTNPFDCDAGVTVRAVVQDDFFPTGATSLVVGAHATIIHGISENPNEDPPSGGTGLSPVFSNWSWANIEFTGRNYNPNPAQPWLGVDNQYTNETRYLYFRKILAPGETLTLYEQWFFICYQEQSAGVENPIAYGFHAASNTKADIQRGVKYL